MICDIPELSADYINIILQGVRKMIIKLSRFHFIVFAVIVLSLCLTYGIATKKIAVETSVNAGVKLPVIMYHHITAEPGKKSKYVISVDDLEKDFAFLSENGYKTVSARQAADYAAGRGTLPEKPVIITFDDGFESVYAYAFPLLKKYSMTAEVFVVGSICDFYSSANDHNLSYSYLTWDEIKEMSDSGFVNVQNHTYNLHSNTAGRDGMKMKSGESEAKYKKLITEDLVKNNEKIKAATGKSPAAVAYPFGSFGKVTAQTVGELGFSAAFTCEEKVNGLTFGGCRELLTLGRFNRSGNIGTAEFFEKLK